MMETLQARAELLRSRIARTTDPWLRDNLQYDLEQTIERIDK